MEALSPAMIALGALAGVFKLALVSALSFRMGRKGKWLAAPWAVALVLAALQFTAIKQAAASSGIELHLPTILSQVCSACANSTLFVMIIVLVIAGVPRAKVAPVEVF
jgi:hypothetical protein